MDKDLYSLLLLMVQAMDAEDDRVTSALYAEGGSNYTTISSLAWRYAP